ncbi:protein of unknown function [Modestobacter italicus]|uniref:Uncharacterized protein n=1 Tax=Modestobacter italicus (strain DSM 44449 / CECT 9708 / BC 501) TaxID=2732864 RepID=I4EYH3_MODI5|nr:protein of unknown function [Modestobacter marinus]
MPFVVVGALWAAVVLVISGAIRLGLTLGTVATLSWVAWRRRNQRLEQRVTGRDRATTITGGAAARGGNGPIRRTDRR